MLHIIDKATNKRDRQIPHSQEPECLKKLSVIEGIITLAVTVMIENCKEMLAYQPAGQTSRGETGWHPEVGRMKPDTREGGAKTFPTETWYSDQDLEEAQRAPPFP